MTGAFRKILFHVWIAIFALLACGSMLKPAEADGLPDGVYKVHGPWGDTQVTVEGHLSAESSQGIPGTSINLDNAYNTSFNKDQTSWFYGDSDCFFRLKNTHCKVNGVWQPSFEQLHRVNAPWGDEYCSVYFSAGSIEMSYTRESKLKTSNDFCTFNGTGSYQNHSSITFNEENRASIATDIYESQLGTGKDLSLNDEASCTVGLTDILYQVE